MTSRGYQLLDSGEGAKLERFGSFVLARPCAHAVWKKQLSETVWREADAYFSRDPESRWYFRRPLPPSWVVEVAGVSFRIMPTDFGHLGIFPEQKQNWEWIGETLKEKKGANVLNLFAYSGGSTLVAAKAGAILCHLDASKGMVTWARENAEQNGLEKAPIRWIVEDVRKFLGREKKRGVQYDAIILDPPTFGRGAKGELFKIEEEIVPLLQECRQLLSDHPLFLLCSCHTPGFSPLVMQRLLQQAMEGKGGHVRCGEMLLEGKEARFSVPNGVYGRWTGEI